MLHESKPLLPDHVFKCNIATCNIEMPQVESLYLRLNHLKELLAKEKMDKGTIFLSTKAFLSFFDEKVGYGDAVYGFPDLFSFKETRGIFESFKQFANGAPLSVGKFLDFVDSFDRYVEDYGAEGYGEKIRELRPEAFQRLMEILLVDTGLADGNQPPAQAPSPFFTGRKIEHLAVCGYKTMGDRSVYDPTRNLFELLHVFSHLSRAMPPVSVPPVVPVESRLHELLAHVVVKKSLWE